jgi:hypothetical protein
MNNELKRQVAGGGADLPRVYQAGKGSPQTNHRRHVQTRRDRRGGTVILYHGTLASLIPSILCDGLKPRGESKSHDEYIHSLSMPHLVYLTSSFGLALQHACRISERTAEGAEVAVLQLEMDSLKRRLLYPDEDYLEHEWNSDFIDWTLKEQLAFIERKRDTWKESLDLFKTVAYKGAISATALAECRVPRWLEQEKRRRFIRRAS